MCTTQHGLLLCCFCCIKTLTALLFATNMALARFLQLGRALLIAKTVGVSVVAMPFLLAALHGTRLEPSQHAHLRFTTSRIHLLLNAGQPAIRYLLLLRLLLMSDVSHSHCQPANTITVELSYLGKWPYRSFLCKHKDSS